jgi:hypothetical protein
MRRLASVCDFVQPRIKEAIMRTFLLAAVFASALATGAIAQTYDPSIPPRDPAFGKGNADNDTFHQLSETDIRSWGNAYNRMTYGETWNGISRRQNRR